MGYRPASWIPYTRTDRPVDLNRSRASNICDGGMEHWPAPTTGDFRHDCRNNVPFAGQKCSRARPCGLALRPNHFLDTAAQLVDRERLGDDVHPRFEMSAADRGILGIA